jgi:predicted alpha/beta superfamily hydrolase
MKKFQLFFAFLFFSSVLFAQHRVHIGVDDLPATPRAMELYIAGSFNNWNPADEKYKFQRKENGEFYIAIALAEGTYEYKITRGGWSTGECNADGSDRANRTLKVAKEEILGISIAGWKDNFAALPEVKSTAGKHVRVADSAIYIPQLGRKRRIWIYLPEGYAASKQRYPVLYMHDGQNVFDEKTSFAGEWGADEFMDTVSKKKCIIVAIDNGGLQRTNEYSPWDFRLIPNLQKINKGEGKAYTDFLVKTLKPYIDRKYRTLRDKNNTWIAGGSMGGLISLYAVVQYPAVFGGAGIFSPSVWICRNELLQFIKQKGKKVNSRIFFFCSKKESPSMAPDMLLAFEQLAAVSKSKMTTIIRDEGLHSERTWRKELPLFYEWIVGSKK